MFKIFTERVSDRVPIVLNSNWRTVSNYYNKHFDNLEEYYRTSTATIENGNVLSRILNNSLVSMNNEVYEFYFKIDDKSRFIAKTFNIVDETNKGSIVDFYGPTIFILDNNPIDIDNNITEWKNIEPIKYLSNTNTDLIIPHLSEYHNNDIKIISINIAMLALQYLGYVKDNNINNKSINSFLFRYPINNLNRSNVPLATFNRLSNINNIKNNNFKLPRSIRIINSKLDKLLLSMQSRYYYNRMSYYSILSSIPNILKLKHINVDDYKLIPNYSIYEDMLIDDYITIQNTWVYLLSRLDYLVMLKWISPKSDNMNVSTLTKAKTILKRLERDNILNNIETILTEKEKIKFTQNLREIL